MYKEWFVFSVKVLSAMFGVVSEATYDLSWFLQNIVN
jgi:hypothetical protein